MDAGAAGAGRVRRMRRTIPRSPSCGRDVLASSLQVTAGLTNDQHTGAPTKTESADADKILTECADPTPAES